MKRKKEMHIVHIITKLELGGAQKICLSLVKNLPEYAVSTSLITGAEGILRNQVDTIPSVYLCPDFKREVSFFGFLSELKTFIFLIKTLKKLKKQYPEILAHTHSTKAGLMGRWAAFFSGIKKRVHTVHGYGFHTHQNKLIWLIIYCLELFTSFITTHYICVSTDDAKIGIKLFPKFNKKHSIIRAAVDWQQFIPATITHSLPQPFPLAPAHFIFGTIACFKPQKNLIDLLKAFTVTHQKNPYTRLEIIGDGPERALLEHFIKEHNLTHAVILHGWQEHVANFLMHWHAFVLSSLWEGLPCSIVEARLFKLPILSYDTGGIKDIVINNYNGFLYQQKNWQALSNGMLELSNNKQLFTKFQNYQEDLTNFKLTTMLTQHHDLYQILR